MNTARKPTAEKRPRLVTIDTAPEPRELKMRAAERIPAIGEVHLRRSGSLAFQVQLLDASERGCKVELIETPSIGESVWVKFQGLDSIEATVCWVAGSTGGLQFQRPIHPAVFSALTRRIGRQPPRSIS